MSEENPFTSVVPDWLNDEFTLDVIFGSDGLRAALYFIAFFILTVSIILKVARQSQNDPASLLGPVLQAFVITGIISTTGYWMPLIWQGFNEIAYGYLGLDKTTELFEWIIAGAKVLQKALPTNNESQTALTGASLMASLSSTLGYILLTGAAVIQKFFWILQYVLIQISYLIAPIALACYAIESTKGIATKFVQQTLSLMAWAVGFAFVNQITLKLFNSFFTSPLELTNLFMDAFLGDGDSLGAGAVAKLGIVCSFLIGGTVAIPMFMQGLFVGGTVMAGQGMNASSMMGGGGLSKGAMAGGLGSMLGGANASSTPLAGGNTAALGSRAGYMSGAQMHRAGADAALTPHASSSSAVHQSFSSHGAMNVSAKSSTATPALTGSALSLPGNSLDIAAGMASQSIKGGGSTPTSSPISSNPINQAAFSHNTT